jgi:ribose-phosphate pyrophosphokinase
LIIGPDSESEQWVSVVAKDANAPFAVLDKVPHRDRDVRISLNRLDDIESRTPVLVDDIISSGKTMLEAVRLLRARGTAARICIAVHGIFADESDLALVLAGARVITSNSVPNSTSAIDVAPALAEKMREMWSSTGPPG